ncbi:MAG: diguanylate cyclase [Gemmatimonadota bacterium]
MNQAEWNHMEERALPLRALILSLGALAIPVAAAFLFPGQVLEDSGPLIWLTALVPAFLLTYYRGWGGASVGLATGMAALSMTHAVVVITGRGAPNWGVLLGVVTVLIAICLGVGWMVELLHRERRAAESMALTDPLTGLANRRHAELILDTQCAAAERGMSLSAVLFDLDRFKEVNDSYGHAQGDLVIQSFAEILKDGIRRMDLAVRWGGEEFLLILPASAPLDAKVVVERALEALRDTPFAWGRVTVSAGVAGYQKGMGGSDVLVAAADSALYRAKAEGRDRVVVAQGQSEGGTPGQSSGPAAGHASGLPAAMTPTRRPGGKEESTGPTRVLLVDDDPGTLHGVGRLLKRLGYMVYSASDPTKALTLALEASPPFDIIVTDLIMPGMSGFTLVEQLEESGLRLPVLYMSGYVHGEVGWPGAPGLRHRFLEKPMGLAELTVALEELTNHPGERGTPAGDG